MDMRNSVAARPCAIEVVFNGRSKQFSVIEDFRLALSDFDQVPIFEL
jgi:hypothetical protein